MKHKQQQKSKSKSKNKIDKKASLKDTIVKIVDVVKKPFNSLPKKEKNIKDKKQRKEKILIQQNDDNNVLEQEKQNESDVPFAENSTVTQLSKFFYSNDRFIDTFDDIQLYDAIIKHYPSLAADESSEHLKRKAIIDLLNDTDFMSNILDNYNITVLDFFRFLFRLCPSIFKGFFVKKIQKTLKTKRYARTVKFAKYNFSQGRKKKRKFL